MQASVVDDNGIKYIARQDGTAGNGITIEVLSGSADDVAVVGDAITVTLNEAETTATGIITQGADEITLTAEAAAEAGNGIIVNLVKRESLASLPLSSVASAQSDEITVYLEIDGSTDVLANFTTALVGTNNDLVFTSNLGGPIGNTIQVSYVEPVEATAETTALIVGNRVIQITLAATGSPGSFVITSTAAQVKAAIEANFETNNLVTVANAAANDGTGVVTTTSFTLANGTFASAVSTVQEVIDEINGNVDNTFVVASLTDGAGTEVVTVNKSATTSGGLTRTPTKGQLGGLINQDDEAKLLVYADVYPSISGGRVVYTGFPVTLSGGSVAPGVDDGVVHYDQSQALTDGQKEQARENIGANLSAKVAFARRSSILILTNGVSIEIPLNEVVYDAAGMVNTSTGRIHCLRSGWYNLTINGTLKNPSTPIPRVTFNVNIYTYSDNILTDVYVDFFGLVGYQTVTKTVPIYLNQGDYLKFFGYQNSGIDIQVEEDSEASRPFLALSEIDPHEPPALAPTLDRQIVAVGDSNTAGSALQDPDLVWGNYLTSNFVGFGHPGATAADILASYMSEVTDNANPGADFILPIGSNDVGLDADPDISAIADDIEAILDVARPLSRSITWVTPGPSYNTYANTDYETDRQALIAEIVSRGIPGLHIARIDLDPLIGPAVVAKNREYFVDHLHWSPITQKIVADVILGVLP